jgi:hypothetical protein
MEVLSLGGSFSVDIESVLDQPPGHPWHVRWLPHEDVSVSPEEADECIFLFWVETRPDHGSFAAVARLEVNGFHLHFLWWLRLVIVDAKCAPSAKHTASRTSWLHTRKESRDVPVNFP